MQLNCIILAAGYGKRMGENKLLLPFNGKKLLEWTIDLVQNITFQETAIVTTHEIKQAVSIPASYTIIINTHPEKGQSHSIHLGLKHIKKSNGNMFCVGDQPFLTPADISLLVEAFYQYPGKIIVPLYENKKGSPTIFPYSMNSLLMSLSGDIGGRNIIASHPGDVHFVTMPQHSSSIDIDTRADYITYGQKKQ